MSAIVLIYFQNSSKYNTGCIVQRIQLLIFTVHVNISNKQLLLVFFHSTNKNSHEYMYFLDTAVDNFLNEFFFGNRRQTSGIISAAKYNSIHFSFDHFILMKN